MTVSNQLGGCRGCESSRISSIQRASILPAAFLCRRAYQQLANLSLEGINVPGLDVTTTIFAFYFFTFFYTFPILLLPCLALPCSTSDRVYHLIIHHSRHCLLLRLLLLLSLLCCALLCSACSLPLFSFSFFSFISHLFCSLLFSSVLLSSRLFLFSTVTLEYSCCIRRSILPSAVLALHLFSVDSITLCDVVIWSTVAFKMILLIFQ